MTKEPEEKLEPQAPEEEEQPSFGKLAKTVLLALGVVYGDLGCNVLFTLKTALSHKTGLTPDHATILGLLSLIFWSLIIVVSIKYVAYVMNADNHGEGGVIALMAQVHPRDEPRTFKRWFLVMMGLFGATILYGDCTVTGAISVLSAVEGLNVAAKGVEPFVVPITVIILIVLYLFKRQGTKVVGAAFGPIMLLWFATITILGISAIGQKPQVLAAVNPAHAVTFFGKNGWHGFFVLGVVFLAVTGAEALFTDIGHFGKTPIRIGWFIPVLPALLCNYFGQGAFLMGNPQSIQNPFYSMAPHWALYPLVVLATLATVIASQAVISGTFSITRQAVQLGFFPRLKIEHTSQEHVGQVYIGVINWVLGACTIGLVIAFQESTKLANAYGVPVSTTMIITTILAAVIVYEKWKWPKWIAVVLAVFFLIPDTTFFASNLIKIAEGGWFPMLVGILVFVLTSTWRRGNLLLSEEFKETRTKVEEFLEKFQQDPPQRVEGTAVYLTGSTDGVPGAFLSQLEHFKVVHEMVVFLTLVTESIPRMPKQEIIEKTDLGQGFNRVISHHGFQERRDMMEIFELLRSREMLDLDMEKTSFILGQAKVIPEGFRMSKFRSRIFAFVIHNSVDITDFIDIPSARVIELGVLVDL
jgi:KUP system potassium uptake protein